MASPPQLRAFAKLTRTLTVTGVRADGYHLLESEMVTIGLADELSLGPAKPGRARLEVVDGIDWTRPSRRRLVRAHRPVLEVPTDEDNLVLRACRIAGLDAGIRLVKRIPAGAGLGGGSADAAAVLREAGIFDPQRAVELGADVPFCLRGGRALVSGIGERLVSLPFEERVFLLCTPPIAVATGAVYRAYDELAGRGREPRAAGPNDLEAAALAVEPRLGRWRDLLERATGERPVLAGSGSTWFVEVGEDSGESLRARTVAEVRRSGSYALVVLARSVPGSAA